MGEDGHEAGLDSSMGAVLLAHMWEIWVGPEVERRGLAATPETVQKIVVELPPGGPVSVAVDDEAAIYARFKAATDIAEGAPVYASDVSEVLGIQPAEVGPTSGWICFARLGTGDELIAFDFTYNRQRAQVLLDRARSFLSASREAGRRALVVCLDTAFSAAELAVQVEMLFLQEETDNHRVRGRWLSNWSALGNTPETHSHALWELTDLRKRARYGYADIRLSEERLRHLLHVVDEMIDHAEARLTPVGEALSEAHSKARSDKSRRHR